MYGPELVRAGYDRLGARYRDWSHGSSVRLRFLGELIDRLAPPCTSARSARRRRSPP